MKAQQRLVWTVAREGRLHGEPDLVSPQKPRRERRVVRRQRWLYRPRQLRRAQGGLALAEVSVAVRLRPEPRVVDLCDAPARHPPPLHPWTNRPGCGVERDDFGQHELHQLAARRIDLADRCRHVELHGHGGRGHRRDQVPAPATAANRPLRRMHPAQPGPLQRGMRTPPSLARAAPAVGRLQAVATAAPTADHQRRPRPVALQTPKMALLNTICVVLLIKHWLKLTT